MTPKNVRRAYIESPRRSHPTRSDILTILRNMVPKIASQTRCILVFGSYARKALEPVTDQSDIDIFVVFKSDARIASASQVIHSTLTETGLDYDYLWRTEDLLHQQIEEGTDTYLYYNILLFGETLYEEQHYVLNIKKRLMEREWTMLDVRNTVENRISKIFEEKRKIVHHLERIIFEIEAFKSLERKNNVEDSPRFQVLLRRLLSTQDEEQKGVIDFLQKEKKHVSGLCNKEMFDGIARALAFVLEMYADLAGDPRLWSTNNQSSTKSKSINCCDSGLEA